VNNSFPPEKILVALDGSAVAQNAAKVAIQIAQADSKLIQGIYIVDEPLVFDPYADYSKELGRDLDTDSRDVKIEWFEKIGFSALDQLQELCTAKSVSVTTENVLGDVPEIILNRTSQVAMLALGRRGNGHASVRGYLGKNFRHIAHHAQVPQIVGGDVDRPVEHIFLVFDGSEKAFHALDWVVHFQQIRPLNIVVGLIEEGEPVVQVDSSQGWFTQRGLKTEAILDLRSESIPKVVSEVMASQADLVLLAGYHKPEIVSWLAGSSLDQILKQCPLPALVF
jgi:nucleotide-binding universal stress UspA family protein